MRECREDNVWKTADGETAGCYVGTAGSVWMGRMVELVPGRYGRDGRVDLASLVGMVGGRVGMARSLWSIGFSPPPRTSHALKVPTRVERMPTSLGSQVAHCWCNPEFLPIAEKLMAWMPPGTQKSSLKTSKSEKLPQ